MKSRAKHLMDFVETNEISTVYHGDFEWRPEAEAKLNQFMEKQVDPRLKDAKNEIESLRMELRETRKTLETSQEDLAESEESLRYARAHAANGEFEF